MKYCVGRPGPAGLRPVTLDDAVAGQGGQGGLAGTKGHAEAVGDGGGRQDGLFSQEIDHAMRHCVLPHPHQAHPPFGEECLGPSQQLAGRLAAALERNRHPFDPGVEVAHAEERHARQVPTGIPGNEDTDWWRNREIEAVTEHPADQNAADASVAVAIGMDGLELRVHDGGLRHGVERIIVGKRNQVLHQFADEFGRRRDVAGVPRRRTSDPRLLGAIGAHHGRGQGASRLHQPPMPEMKVGLGEPAPRRGERADHCAEIVGHVGRGVAERPTHLGRSDVGQW